MTNKVTLNTSIAAVVDIDNVGEREKVEIYFTAEENWTGTFTFNLWASHLKTKEFETTGLLSIVDNVMTLIINADDDNIEAGQYYYEIFSDLEERIFFKGSLKVIK